MIEGWWFLAFSIFMVIGAVAPLFKKDRAARTLLPPRKETLTDWRSAETLKDWHKKPGKNKTD